MAYNYNSLYYKQSYNTACKSSNTTINNYYNNYNNNKEIIKVDVSNNYYFTVELNNFNKIYELFIINAKNVYLPLMNNDLFIGFTVKIINMCENIINIHSRENQLIYSNLYAKNKGEMKTILIINSSFVFTVIKKKDIFSWIMV